jgi:hypothetical protein
LANSFTDSAWGLARQSFTSSTTWTVPTGITSVNYLVVAGGGGGGGAYQGPGSGGSGGGGGAGGYRTGTLSVTPGASLTVTVGAAGSAGAANTSGGNGGDSVFDSITSTGGGGGGKRYASGNDGGSGGGGGVGGAEYEPGDGNTPSTSPSQGNNGGTNSGSKSSGGGGGSGSVGGNASAGAGGSGGSGTANDITGASVTYAAGGAGGFQDNHTSGATGAANTGNGGGGGQGGNNVGGAGGSGFVAISYTSTTTARHTITANGDVKNVRGADLDTEYTVIDAFTSTGSDTWTCPSGVTEIEVLTVAGGGGGGGYYYGGGGGSGGIVHDSTYAVTAGVVYDLSVGAGGAGGGATTSGTTGTDSVFNVNAEGSGLTLTAKGGGGGGSYGTGDVDGKDGGSGGGAGARNGTGTGGSTNQGSFSGATSYGNAGGSAGGASSAGSGGGGAGEAGNTDGAPSGGAGGHGGDGRTFSTFSSYGASGIFGGGGGGGSGESGSAYGPGGTGGGGNGAQYNSSAAVAGTANTGGGGGAGSYHIGSPSTQAGAAGGSGVVLIKYTNTKPGSSSIEFDGTGDYLSTADSSDWDFSGQFTIEGWFNWDSVHASVTGDLIGTATNAAYLGSSKSGWVLGYKNSSTDLMFAYQSNNSWDFEYSFDFTPSLGAWYHVAVSRDGSNDIRMFVDGVQVGSTESDSTSLATTESGPWIGGGYNSTARLLDGYMDEIRISNTARYTAAFTPQRTQFTADANTKLLIHSDYTGGLGADSSGNYNNFTATNLVATDQMPDTPTRNWCTLNPLDKRGTLTLSEGNLKGVTNASDPKVRATIAIPQTGKWYWEFLTQYSTSIMIGADDQTNDGSSWYSNNATVLYNSGNGNKYNFSSTSSYGASWTTGDIIGVALNRTDNEITFYKNNVAQPTLTMAGTAAQRARLMPFLGTGTGGDGGGTFNFGQDSSFAGAKTAQGNKDSNDQDEVDFYYTPPSGYLALLAENLSDPEIKLPGEHMGTALFTGTGSELEVSSLSFQPDFTWIKTRQLAYNHRVFDVNRGVTKELYTNTANAEVTDAQSLKSFDSDGFTLGTSSGVNPSSSSNMVSWNWKAGGAASTNTDGDIDTEVSANTSAGFSIITYTGDGTSGQTIGHGLGVVPEMLISFNRDGGNPWVWHKDLSSGAYNTYLQLNAVGAVLTTPSSGYFTAMSTSTLTMTTGASSIANLNTSGDDYLLYAFSGIEGYSKVGSYVTNNTADNAFAYTGFKPAWAMVKSIASGNYNTWTIIDNKRDTYNVADVWLTANGACQENYSSNTGGSCISRGDIDIADFVSNGFKIRSSSGEAGGGPETYIYLAFAESPFKYSNAR